MSINSTAMFDNNEVNPMAWPEKGFITDSLHRAAAKGLLRDDALQQTFVAVSPGYAVTKAERSRVLGCRIFVCLCTFLVVIFSIIGLSNPYARFPGSYYDTNYFSHKYSSDFDDALFNTQPTPALVLGIIAPVAAFVAMIMLIAHVAIWDRDCAAREVDERENGQLQHALGAVLKSDAEKDGGFPFSNGLRLHRCQHETVPFEVEEAKRARKDHQLGMAIFAFLVITAVSSWATMILVSTDMPQAFHTSSGAKVEPGFFFVVLSVVFSTITLLTFAAAHPVHVQFSNPPVERCRFMIVGNVQTPSQRSLLQLARKLSTAE